MPEDVRSVGGPVDRRRSIRGGAEMLQMNGGGVARAGVVAACLAAAAVSSGGWVR